jgi:hypothetical protein
VPKLLKVDDPIGIRLIYEPALETLLLVNRNTQKQERVKVDEVIDGVINREVFTAFGNWAVGRPPIGGPSVMVFDPLIEASYRKPDLSRSHVRLLVPERSYPQTSAISYQSWQDEISVGRKVDPARANRLLATLQNEFSDMSTVWVAGNVDHVDPPMDETSWPLSVVSPLILVPEMSSPEASRMYDQLIRACPDISTVDSAGFKDHSVGAPAAPVGPVTDESAPVGPSIPVGPVGPVGPVTPV